MSTTASLIAIVMFLDRLPIIRYTFFKVVEICHHLDTLSEFAIRFPNTGFVDEIVKPDGYYHQADGLGDSDCGHHYSEESWARARGHWLIFITYGFILLYFNVSTSLTML